MRLLTIRAVILSSNPLLGFTFPTAIPEEVAVLEVRQGLEWPKCLGTGTGSCTVYMATGDERGAIYRTATLFDNQCKLTHAVMTVKTNKIITLKGHLPHPVELSVDESVRPGGWLAYMEADTPLGDSMACYKYPGTDGVGCRKAFDCSDK